MAPTNQPPLLKKLQLKQREQHSHNHQWHVTGATCTKRNIVVHVPIMTGDCKIILLVQSPIKTFHIQHIVALSFQSIASARHQDGCHSDHPLLEYMTLESRPFTVAVTIHVATTNNLPFMVCMIIILMNDFIYSGWRLDTGP